MCATNIFQFFNHLYMIDYNIRELSPLWWNSKCICIGALNLQNHMYFIISSLLLVGKRSKNYVCNCQKNNSPWVGKREREREWDDHSVATLVVGRLAAAVSVGQVEHTYVCVNLFELALVYSHSVALVIPSSPPLVCVCVYDPLPRAVANTTAAEKLF